MTELVNGRSINGCLVNPVDARDQQFHFGPGYSAARQLPLPPMPRECSLRAHAGVVYSQGPAPSCVAQAVAKAIEITERRAYRFNGNAARNFMFWNSRAYHGDQRRYTGTHIRSCLQGVRTYGAPDEHYMPYDSTLKGCTKRPPMSAYFKAYGKETRRRGTYEACFDAGEHKVRAIKEALVRGYPVIFGTSIDSAFTKNKGPVLVTVPDELSGRHAMVCIGYREGDNGTEFEILNSWSNDWRAGGVVWFTEDYVKWEEFRDVCIYFGWH